MEEKRGEERKGEERKNKKKKNKQLRLDIWTSEKLKEAINTNI